MSIGEDGFKPVSATQRRKGKHGKRAAVNTPFDTQLQRTVAELDTDGWSESVKGTISLTTPNRLTTLQKPSAYR